MLFALGVLAGVAGTLNEAFLGWERFPRNTIVIGVAICTLAFALYDGRLFGQRRRRREE